MHHSPTYFILYTFTAWCEYVKYALGIKIEKILEFGKGWRMEERR
jgi:hypothetical protein